MKSELQLFCCGMQLTRASEGRSEPSQGLDLIWGLAPYGATLPDLLLLASTFILQNEVFIQFYSFNLNAEIVVMHAEIRVASELQASWIKLNLTNSSRSVQTAAIHNRLRSSYMQTSGSGCNILFIHAHVTDSGLGASWRAAWIWSTLARKIPSIHSAA